MVRRAKPSQNWQDSQAERNEHDRFDWQDPMPLWTPTCRELLSQNPTKVVWTRGKVECTLFSVWISGEMVDGIPRDGSQRYV